MRFKKSLTIQEAFEALDEMNKFIVEAEGDGETMEFILIDMDAAKLTIYNLVEDAADAQTYFAEYTDYEAHAIDILMLWSEICVYFNLNDSWYYGPEKGFSPYHN